MKTAYILGYGGRTLESIDIFVPGLFVPAFLAYIVIVLTDTR